MTLTYEYNSNITCNDAIMETLILIGKYEAGEDITADDYATCVKSANMMLRSWQMAKIGMWKNKEIAVFLDGSSQYYDIGPTSTNHVSADYFKTEIATARAMADTTVIVNSVSGISDSFDRNAIMTSSQAIINGALTFDGVLENNSIAILPESKVLCFYSSSNLSTITFSVYGEDYFGNVINETITGPNNGYKYTTKEYKKVTEILSNTDTASTCEIGIVGDWIGVQLDDWTIQWSHIISSPITTTMTISDALTDTSAVGNFVYTHATRSPRPLRIIEQVTHFSYGNDVSIRPISRQEYKALSKKDVVGNVNQIYYDRQTLNGRLFIWPLGQNVQQYLLLTARFPIMTMSNPTDYIDIPEEYIEAFIYNLAVSIAPKFGGSLDQIIMAKAVSLYEDMKDDDSEDTSVFIGITNKRF